MSTPATARNRERLGMAVVLLAASVIGVIATTVLVVRAFQRGAVGSLAPAANYRWPVIPPGSVTFTAYATLGQELASSRHSVRAGVALHRSKGTLSGSMEGVFTACSADPQMVLLILEPPAGGEGIMPNVGMVVKVCWLSRAPGGPLLPEDGTVQVFAVLTPQQAGQAKAGSLPPALVQALVDTAHGNGWAPAPTVGTERPAAPAVEVDPAPFFPSPPIAP